uniref:Uncharacterized protein n=1 Tax=Heterorhabditis bacteriophora TaxID=37862 RepID=A0A1I7W6R1_HETBA
MFFPRPEYKLLWYVYIYKKYLYYIYINQLFFQKKTRKKRILKNSDKMKIICTKFHRNLFPYELENRVLVGKTVKKGVYKSDEDLQIFEDVSVIT